MAASYIRIALLILCGVALLAFAVGFAAGKWSRKALPALLALCGIGIALLIALAMGTRSLSVSGPLINRQVLALWFEVQAALLCGWSCGQIGRREKRGALLALSLPLGLMSLAAVAIQIRNVQPVLETLQTAGILKPRDEYKPETNKDCPANLQSLYNAFQQYADLNDKLPDAANWEDNTDLTSRIPQDEWLHCPAVSNRHDAKFGYALNGALAGKKLNLNGKPLSSLPNAATTPLLYDSTNLSKNAHDAGVSMPKPGRHGGRNNILYLDGHVAAVAPK